MMIRRSSNSVDVLDSTVSIFSIFSITVGIMIQMTRPHDTRVASMRQARKPTNPFKPTAGMTPHVLVGRESVIDDFVHGLEEEPGSPGRLMHITGPRGSGKTVLGVVSMSPKWHAVYAIGQTARTRDDLVPALLHLCRPVCSQGPLESPSGSVGRTREDRLSNRAD